MSLKNIAGNDVSIFLFCFELCINGIDFVLNEAIAADMYPDVDGRMGPLVHACCETLLRYRRLSAGDTIMDGSFLAAGEFEVMLSKGLGRHFAHDDKERLFRDAKAISDLLAEVMDRRTRELKQGKQRNPPRAGRAPSPGKIKKGLEELGQAKRRQATSQWIAEGGQLRPGLRRLGPGDLPPGVTASSGYDHRGHCYVFEHEELGELGRIVLSGTARDRETLMRAELYTGREEPGSAVAEKKREMFGQVVSTVSAAFDRSPRSDGTALPGRRHSARRSGLSK